MPAESRVRLLGTLSQWAALVICAALGFALFAFVDLTPQVEDDFFFSNEDPQLQESLRIEREFGESRQIFIAAQSGNLVSRQYIDNIASLTADLQAIEGVEVVRSLTRGLEEPEKAAKREPDEIFKRLAKSPFWTQLLLTPGNEASMVVLRLAQDQTQTAVQQLDRVVEEYDAPEFRLAVSGVPYVAEHIRQRLVHDLKLFSTSAILMFGLLMGLLFRSSAVVMGMMVAALAASFGTFLARAAFGMETDILAPNLWTIAFVLTLSHVVYLTAQWGAQAEKFGAQEAVRRSVSLTGPASAWALAANLLGFATLIFVSAKPLRQFGISGAIAASLAMLCAYTLFPPFLRAAKAKPRSRSGIWKSLEGFFTRKHPLIAAAVLVTALVLAPFAWRTNSDPNLPSYFSEGGAVGQGLRAIDPSTGSSPLDLVVVNATGAPLDNRDSFERLMALHNALRENDEVGSALSIALLMEETDRRWYSFLFGWDRKLKQLEKPEQGRIGDAFISDDRMRGRYILRMHEIGRERPRAEIVSEIENIVADHGFKADAVGGLYVLQGEMSKLVDASVVRGLGGLLALFFVIVLIVSRSLRTALAMALCLTATPLILFGAAGLLRMPLDIIAAPAANVALPLGIDEMIHLGYYIRRRRAESDDKKADWTLWRQALQALWMPILFSMLIVVSGFALFALSSFPPTQRLGILVCAGAALTDLVVLAVLPAVAVGRGHTKSPAQFL